MQNEKNEKSGSEMEGGKDEWSRAEERGKVRKKECIRFNINKDKESVEEKLK